MLERLRIDPCSEGGSAPEAGLLEAVGAEFPSVGVVVGPPGGAEVSIRVEDWESWRFDPYAMDAELRRLADLGPMGVALVGGARVRPALAVEVLGRCQRFTARRNRASSGLAFDRLLAAHRALHDLTKPLVRADWEHALDTWQWMLRLSPDASGAAQAAALLHDVERLGTEADARIEHLAPDYQAFKDDHARRGAALAARVMISAGLGVEVACRAADLVAEHERRRDDAEGALLGEADALSFFSLNAHGFLDYYGPRHTRRKVAHSLGRLGARGRARLHQIRCRPEVAAMVRDELAAAGNGGCR